MTPSPRQTQPAVPTTERGRAMVRDVGAGSTLPARFDVRTAYDFAISLAQEVGEHDELPSEDRRWLERARAALPERVRPAVDSELAIFGSGLIVDRPEITDATSFVDLLQATTGREFVSAVLADQLRDPAREAEIAAALDGDRTAIDAVLASWPEHKHGWLSRILVEPDALVGEVADLMRAWLPLYQEIEPRVRTIIERDVALRAGDRKRLNPADLVERTTNGIRWLSEPGVRRVVLAPSYLARPYNFTFAGASGGSSSTRSPTPPSSRTTRWRHRSAVLRLHRALGDETRLRILRLLRDRDLVPHRDRRAPRAQQADHQAPPRAGRGRGPRDADRGGRAVLLQPPARPPRRRVVRARSLYLS